jgi:rod shape-determining protein MreC
MVFVAALLIVAWSLANLGEERTLAVNHALRASVLFPFVVTHEAFAERGKLRERTAQLLEERERLSRDVLRSADLRKENTRLRQLLELDDPNPGDFTVVELVPGAPTIGESHTFLVRAGRRDGIDAPVGLATTDGLVGVVRTVGRTSGWGEYWTHPEFRVSVVSDGLAATGIVRATRLDSGETLMLLEHVPFSVDLAPGTEIRTSGAGGIYPPGIPVGRVVSLAEERSGWSKSYVVEPAARPGQSSFAQAWLRPPVPETPPPAPVDPLPPAGVEDLDEGVAGGTIEGNR